MSAPTPPLLARYPSLRDRAVFVTGGATGIGAAIVTALARQGARVAFVDIAADAGQALTQQLAAEGLDTPWWRRCDVRDVAALQAAVHDAERALGDLAGLVNNVANDTRQAIAAVTTDSYDHSLAVNQRCGFFAMQAALPGMQRLGFGSVVNIGSVGWQVKAGGYPLYAMAKSSVNGLVRGLARELGQQRIRINTVSPGWVMTERQLTQWFDAEGKAELQRNQCLPDLLQPQDVANLVMFLIADDGAMCTGQEFKVDAGWS